MLHFHINIHIYAFGVCGETTLFTIHPSFTSYRGIPPLLPPHLHTPDLLRAAKPFIPKATKPLCRRGFAAFGLNGFSGAQQVRRVEERWDASVRGEGGVDCK